MPAGRPSTYDPDYCGKVIELGDRGMSECQISARLGVPRTTMRSWADQHPEFSSSLARAKELEQAWWEDQALSALRDRDFNASLWTQNVKSRFRKEYGDKIENTVQGPDGKPLFTWLPPQS